jgi:hypothetical protein
LSADFSKYRSEKMVGVEGKKYQARKWEVCAPNNIKGKPRYIYKFYV